MLFDGTLYWNIMSFNYNLNALTLLKSVTNLYSREESLCMPDKFIFTDEAGCFTFNREPNVSKYFILCTVTMDDCSIGYDLIELRKKLAWEGLPLGDYFHATTDAQSVRDEVYRTIMKRPFTVQATVMEKSKASPKIKESKPKFYQYGHYYHFKHCTKGLLDGTNEALVTTASIGVRKERIAFESAVNDVMRQTKRCKIWKSDFMPAQADPCLQLADYCAWALQRKWERSDFRSYDLIKERITHEFDLWSHGDVHHY